MRASRWLLIVCLLASLALPARAERGIVYTNNGQAFEGDIVDEADYVTVNRKGIQSRIPREDIKAVVMTGEPAQAIRQAWGKLNRADAAGRIALARKAFSIGEYEMARDLANEAIAIDANSREAVDMAELVRRQMTMEARAAATTRAAKGPRMVGGAHDTSLAIPTVFVDEADINAIKRAELQDADANFVRVRFNNDVRRRFATLPQYEAARFSQLSAFQQAMTIIREAGPEMRKDVQIGGDPVALRGFRSVQKYILSGCAATQCHGSLAGGNFILYPLADSDPVTYTNFLLLQRYARINKEKPAGIFGGAGARQRMIDRDRPQKSLLVQYGLPPDIADTPHPRVPGFHAAFKDLDDPILRRVGNWIHDDLVQADPIYDVKYVSPVQALMMPEETTQPATAPATRPATKMAAPASQPPRPAPATRPAIAMPAATPH